MADKLYRVYWRRLRNGEPEQHGDAEYEQHVAARIVRDLNKQYQNIFEHWYEVVEQETNDPQEAG